MGWQRIEDRLRARIQQRQVGFIPYLTVGYPDLETTLGLVMAMEELGADVVELGVPFSDPLADGPTIQQAGFHALRQGVTFNHCLELAAAVRRQKGQVPLVFMSYYNPLLAHGLPATARDAAKAGADGFIVPDLPPEEAAPFRSLCEDAGLALIPLLAPTSSQTRIAAGCSQAHGFIYCISLTGVTGARESLAQDIWELAGQVRRATSLPVVVGFGISRREHVAAVGAFADAAVVGSALLDVIGRAPTGQAIPQARQFVAQLMGVTRDAPRSGL
ncbi:MAG: tryptophan synthase subunit alpha [Dehalococcoidia bacterium]|nr:tryptophan synthase subunit alpha [Dehalococcoidia bacterium]